MCANDCRIGVGGKGFCGLVFNVDGQLVRMGGTPKKGVLQWYYDPLPTNCVAWWFCPGCTGAGYPKYSYKKTAETDYSNIAVFYGACSFDCLYCQNWHYRNLASELQPLMSAQSLADKADRHVSCICYFGGDPSVQMPHAIKTSQLAVEKAAEEKRILRICWETNGYWKEEFALKAAELSLNSGGNMKFDLKTWDDNLNMALCGVSNKPTLSSFKMIGEKFFKKRPELPILTASTLLVPGYIDAEEVENLAKFIASIDTKIPYTLLGFYPQYVMSDLPTTSRTQAAECHGIAKKYLENVRIGNIQLLSAG
jgi:pyruvate formate lyase activating enzyme